MFPQLYTAASGMLAGERTVDLVTGNLANVRTPGYRPDRPLFESHLAPLQAVAARGGPAPPVRQVALVSAWRPEEQGPLRETGAPLDVALRGPGYFRVATPQGERLTRSGSFSRAGDGRLITTQGQSVLDDGGRPIVLGQGRVAIGADGAITVNGAALGRLGLVLVSDQELVREGELLFRPTGAPRPVDPRATTVEQGYIEDAAVNATTELVTLIQAQRLYEMQQRLLDLTANTLARRAIDLGEPK